MARYDKYAACFLYGIFNRVEGDRFALRGRVPRALVCSREGRTKSEKKKRKKNESGEKLRRIEERTRFKIPWKS